METIKFIELELANLQSSYYTAIDTTKRAYINGKLYAYSEVLRMLKKEVANNGQVN